MPLTFSHAYERRELESTSETAIVQKSSLDAALEWQSQFPDPTLSRVHCSGSASRAPRMIPEKGVAE